MYMTQTGGMVDGNSNGAIRASQGKGHDNGNVGEANGIQKRDYTSSPLTLGEIIPSNLTSQGETLADFLYQMTHHRVRKEKELRSLAVVVKESRQTLENASNKGRVAMARIEGTVCIKQSNKNTRRPGNNSERGSDGGRDIDDCSAVEKCLQDTCVSR